MKVHFEVTCRLCKDPADSWVCGTCGRTLKIGAFLGILATLAGFPALESLLSLLF